MKPERFLDFWTVQHGRTRRILESLPPDCLGYRPEPGLRSVGELIEHITNIYSFLERMLVHGDYAIVPLGDAPTDLAAAMEQLMDRHEHLSESIQGMSDDRWDAELRPFGYPLPAINAAREVVEHVIHHRGQLSIYAAMLGVKPPYLFAPLDAPLSSGPGM